MKLERAEQVGVQRVRAEVFDAALIRRSEPMMLAICLAYTVGRHEQPLTVLSAAGHVNQRPSTLPSVWRQPASAAAAR